MNGSFMWRVDRRDTHYATQFYFLQTEDPAFSTWWLTPQGNAGLQPSEKLLDGWSRILLGPDSVDGWRYRLDRVWGFGWPARTMSYRETFLYDDSDTLAPPIVVGGLLVRQTPTPLNYARPDALPLIPIWPWFYLQTLIIGAALLVVMMVVRQSRTWRRRKGGRCVRCGYDLRGQLGAGCPECGWNRPVDDAATQ